MSKSFLVCTRSGLEYTVVEDEGIEYIQPDPRFHFDSALQYVGAPQLDNSLGFKPIYRYTQQRKLRVPEAELVIEGYEELDDFVRSANHDHIYDDLHTFRLYTGHVETADKAGTIVPLTPPISEKRGHWRVFGVTTQHAIRADRSERIVQPLRAAACIAAKWKDVLTEDRYVVTAVPSHLPAAVAKSGLVLKRPSSPTECLPLKGSTDADLAAVTIQGHMQDFGRQFYVPVAGEATAGQNVVLLGYGGNVGIDWAQRFLLTPADLVYVSSADYQPDQAGPATASTSSSPSPGLQRIKVLSEADAADKLSILMDEAIHPGYFAASPGRVHASNEDLVEHTCSVTPGFSGAAGVVMEQPWRLLFCHVQSQVSPLKGYSYGVSCSNPVFAALYLRHILPALQWAPTDQIGSDKLAAIYQYVDHFESSHDAWGVTSAVEAFEAAHKRV